MHMTASCWHSGKPQLLHLTVQQLSHRGDNHDTIKSGREGTSATLTDCRTHRTGIPEPQFLIPLQGTETARRHEDGSEFITMRSLEPQQYHYCISSQPPQKRHRVTLPSPRMPKVLGIRKEVVLSLCQAVPANVMSCGKENF